MQVDQKIDGPSWSNWAASAPMPFLRPVDWRRAQGTVEARGDSLRICHDGCAPPIPAIKCTTSLHQIVQWQRKSSARAAWAQNCILQTKVTKVKCLLLCRANGTHCSYCTNTEVIMQNSACSKVGRSKGSCPRNDDVILGSVKDCPFWRAKLRNSRCGFDLQDLFIHKPMCLVRHDKLTVQRLHLPLSLTIASSSFAWVQQITLLKLDWECKSDACNFGQSIE